MIFFHLKIAQIYNYVFLCYLDCFQTKNHKNQRSQIVLNFILKILQSDNRIDIFSPQNSSVIYNYVFLCYLDCFQTI